MKLQWCQIKEMKSPNMFLLPQLFPNKNNPSSTNNNSQVRFISLCDQDNYLLIFIESDVYIYTIDFTASNTSSEIKENFTFKSKQLLDFVAYADKITNITAKKSNRILNNSASLLISTLSGDIFLISINLCDFYIEIVYKFNIRQNFIHEYEVLDYEDERNILLTIDKHLFLYEIYRRSRNDTQSESNNRRDGSNQHTIAKNLLLRVEYLDEKIIDAFISAKKYVVIITNKMIYYVNLDNDGSNEILLKKDPSDYHTYYSGILFDNKIYYIKADNSLCVHPILEPHNKFTVTINTKNQLNKLNFYKVIYCDEEIVAIVNKKQTEIYIFNSKYKLISRESILLENSQFIFTKFGIVVISYNSLGMNVKYKFGMYLKENALSNRSIEERNSVIVRDSFNTDVFSQFQSENGTVGQVNSDGYDLNEIENDFVGDREKILRQREKINENFFEIKSEIRKYFNVAKSFKCCSHYDEDEIFERLKDRINLRLIKLHKLGTNIEKISNKIFARLVKCYIHVNGSSLLRKSYKILNEKYFKFLYKEKINNLLKIAYKTRDYEVWRELNSLLIGF